MQLSYKDCVRLRDAGFPQRETVLYYHKDFLNQGAGTGDSFGAYAFYGMTDCPNTDEIIEALGECLDLEYVPGKWCKAHSTNADGRGKTPLEAVCELFIALSEHKKENE